MGKESREDEIDRQKRLKDEADRRAAAEKVSVKEHEARKRILYLAISARQLNMTRLKSVRLKALIEIGLAMKEVDKVLRKHGL